MSSMLMKAVLVVTIFVSLSLGFHQYSLYSYLGTRPKAVFLTSSVQLQQEKQGQIPWTVTTTRLLMAGKDDAVSRRRSRRDRRREKAKEFGKDNLSSPGEKNFFPEPEPSMEKTSEGLEGRYVEKQVSPEMKAKMEQMRQAGNVGQQSIEEAFGLGDDQLRELMDQELPVPREDLITGKELAEEQVDENKVFNLPDLTSFFNI